MFLYHQRFELTSPFTPLPCAGATAATLTRWTTPPSGNLFNFIVSLVQAPAYRNFIVPALNPSTHMNQHITTPTWTTTKVNLNSSAHTGEATWCTSRSVRLATPCAILPTGLLLHWIHQLQFSYSIRTVRNLVFLFSPISLLHVIQPTLPGTLSTSPTLKMKPRLWLRRSR